jgi:hypothetical protein
MRTHRKLSSVVTGAIVVVGLSGCGGDGPISPSPRTVNSQPTPAPAPITQGPQTVSGVVSEVIDGVTVALEGVNVEDSSRHVSVRTAADGSYNMRDLETYMGNAYLFFSKQGYGSMTRTFTPAGAETRIDIQLARQ